MDSKHNFSLLLRVKSLPMVGFPIAGDCHMEGWPTGKYMEGNIYICIMKANLNINGHVFCTTVCPHIHVCYYMKL